MLSKLGHESGIRVRVECDKILYMKSNSAQNTTTAHQYYIL